MGQKASIVSRGNMSQKSISSSFSRTPAVKKVDKKEGEVSSEAKENPAKTKTCQDTGESSATSTQAPKPEITDGEKENCKSLANGEESSDPPLRKTAVNPFFMSKSKTGAETAETTEENEIKTKTESRTPKPKKKKKKKKKKTKRKISSSDEDNSPVKKSTKKRKGVIES